jgi:hypothetical protein
MENNPLYLTSKFSHFINLVPDWCTEQSSIEMLTSMAALDVMIDMEKIRDKDREDTIRRIHARFVDLFVG